MMKSKNKILDSFEQFISEHVSILKNRIIQITGFKTDFVSSKSINVELSDNVVHINCINSEGAYNILSTVIYKRQMNKIKTLTERLQQNENKESTVSVKLA